MLAALPGMEKRENYCRDKQNIVQQVLENSKNAV
jgi:hypothetical protein